MPKQKNDSNDVKVVTARELLVIRDALTTKYGSRLQPGEALSVSAERTGEHVSVQVVVEAADDSFRLELEAASVPDDAAEQWKPTARFELALDLVDARLAEYFENDRFVQLHDDWRPYEFEGVQMRFRGIERRPDLEKLADAWLEAGGDPDKSDLN